MSVDLNLAYFKAALHAHFQLVLDDGERLDLELSEVKEGLSSPKFTQFSLLFRGPSHLVLPQRIYRFEPESGERSEPFEIFIVPVARDGQGTYYEAIFSQPVQP
jgi:hypothetical protein